jgi:hypothetical protein
MYLVKKYQFLKEPINLRHYEILLPFERKNNGG